MGEGDVVIVPAFGMTVDAMDHMARAGATLVDTTCGSVLNVWKNVQRYARNGFTFSHSLLPSPIHGHEQLFVLRALSRSMS